MKALTKAEVIARFEPYISKFDYPNELGKKIDTVLL
tara:strand:+ start:36 stop:143 length:108 start_codon:yes stop_codon:yes gene_type:complete